MSNAQLQITTSADFTKSTAKLPKEIRAKLNTATKSFFSDADLLGSHLKSIPAADDDIYSLNVDGIYSIIVKRPAKGNVAILLYVGRDNEAQEWARKHRIAVNTTTGGIQTSVALVPNVVRTRGRAKPNAKLSALTDENMAYLGIPTEYNDQIRTKVITPDQLSNFRGALSYATYSALEKITHGLPIDDAMHLYMGILGTAESAKLRVGEDTPGLFDSFSDYDLLSLGIPEQYVELVRSIKIEKELECLASIIPEDAMQSLYALHNGETVSAIQKLTYSDSKSVGEGDYSAALSNPITKAQFAAIDGEESMRALLEYPAAQWRAYLHPSQRRMIERHYGGPARIIGGAGTGKTVVIVHRAKYLTQFCSNGEKIFVTSYNKSLVADIEERLSEICNPAELAKIETMTVDKKTYAITKALGFTVAYEDETTPIWKKAISECGLGSRYTIEFVRDEWIFVIQAQQIETKEDYIKATRTGRSKRLDQTSRELLWSAFEYYKRQCLMQKIVDSDWAQNMCAAECKKYQDKIGYHSILVDECQDLRAPAYRLLRALAGVQRQDDIFFSGDSRQRIYKGRASLSQCGIVINNRSNTLKLNYRTTAEIYESAMKIQKEYQYDDLDGKTVDHDLCTCIFHGEKPFIKAFSSEATEWDAIVEDIKKKLDSGVPSQEICILVRTNTLVSSCADKLLASRVVSLPLSRDQNDDLRIEGVRLATMHRVKGMEYTYVYIPFMKSDYMPSHRELAKCEDDASRQEVIMKAANLLSVAMTRAKRFVWISYAGMPSQFISKLNS